MFQTQFILAYVRRLTGVITNWGSYYKLEQLLEIGANFITNWGITVITIKFLHWHRSLFVQ